MNKKMRIAAISWTGLTAGNFLWQVFATKNWEVAAERSFFQAVALIAFLIAYRER